MRQMQKFSAWLLALFALDAVLFLALYLMLPNTALLKTGVTLTRLSSDKKQFSFVAGPKNRKYVTLNQIPRALPLAVLMLEDSRFYQHRGFDLDELSDAIFDSLKYGKRLRGASTISQQLVKNLYLSSDRSFRRKFVEALITIKLEQTLSKRKILELYLNSIDWGRGTFGIYDAAWVYFKKRPQDLSVKEIAFLAAIIPNPARFGRVEAGQLPKRFVRRQISRVLQRLHRAGHISLEEFEEAVRP